MLIAQLTDTHIKPIGRRAYERVDTASMLRAALDHLSRLLQKPDLILLTGDLVDEGRVEEYAHLREILLSIDIPYLMVPGNHDDRGAMRHAFPDHPWIDGAGFWQFAAHEPGWPVRIVGLDTVEAGRSGGLLCDERLRWLEQTLAQSGRPTLVMMHHPPFVTGIGHMDDIGLDGAAALSKVFARYPQIELVVCGHLHRSIRATVGGRAVMTAPSTAHAVQLDLARDAASMYRMEPPGYLLHWWSGSGLVSHHVHAVDADGPFPFFDDEGELIR